jgi:heat-inducible transcriptional repressor
MVARASNFSAKKAPANPDKRGQSILYAIILEHLATGEPVGSKLLSKKFDDTSGLSSATIRNVMSELEEAGFVEQPHTSAGRVPTDKGYRFYVDNLLGILSLSDEDYRLINEKLGSSELEEAGEPEVLMRKTSQLLSALSQNIGIVVSPSLAHDRLQHIEFVNLSDKRILVVMVSAPNIIHNKVIRLEETYTQDELERTARYLNTEFCGKSLSVIRAEIMRLMHEEKALFDKMLQTAMILCSQSIESETDSVGEVYVDGTSNIISKAEFSDVERLRELLQTIEQKSRLVQILNECIQRDKASKGDVQIAIGSENSAAPFQSCAIITAPYKIGNDSTTGTLSIVGPRRIEYGRTIAIVSYIAKRIEEKLSEESSNS